MTLVKARKPERVGLTSKFFCRYQVLLEFYAQVRQTDKKNFSEEFHLQQEKCGKKEKFYKVKIYLMSFFYFQVLKNCGGIAARSLHHSSYEPTGFMSNEINLPKWSKHEVSPIYFVEINTSQCAWWSSVQEERLLPLMSCVVKPGRLIELSTFTAGFLHPVTQYAQWKLSLCDMCWRQVPVLKFIITSSRAEHQVSIACDSSPLF